jgi:hypothetical protein
MSLAPTSVHPRAVALRDTEDEVEELAKGMVVRHATLGIGRIVALEPTAVHVFFVEGERREATKLRLSAARVFLSAAQEVKDERLQSPAAFAFDPGSGRWALERPRSTPVRKARKAKA